jgi:transposase
VTCANPSTGVINRLGEDPRGGAVFVFINPSRNLLKLLHWDGTGLWVHAIRLDRGTYRWPKPADAKNCKLNLEPAALAMLTDGIASDRPCADFIPGF